MSELKPTAERPFDIVIFDLDGTLVAHHEPIWKTLHTRLGSDPQARRELLQAGLAATISYPDWLAGDVALLQAAGATRDSIAAIVSELSPVPGAGALLTALGAAGVHRALLSGGVHMAIDQHLEAGLLDEVYINQLVFDDDGALIDGRPTPYDMADKGTGVRAIAERRSVPIARVAFVGNGRNDVAGAEAAGYAIAVGDAPDALREVSDCYRPLGDLRALIPLLLGSAA